MRIELVLFDEIESNSIESEDDVHKVNIIFIEAHDNCNGYACINKLESRTNN